MIEWISVNTCKITRIGYSKEVNAMYIDFIGSTIDTPYQNVSEEVFKTFSQAKKIDDFYETEIKNIYQPTQINTESTIDCEIRRKLI